ncbi:MAG: hypothetical protein AB7O62_02410 [Pirellulales bacterium]
MSSSRTNHSRQWFPAAQYSIASLFALVTVSAVLLAIGQYDWHLACILAMLAIGAWITAILARAQWFRATYFCGAFTAGTLWYFVLAIPITPLAGLFYETFPSFWLAFCVCMATLAAAILFRLLRLHEPGYFPLLSGLLFAIAAVTAFYILLVMLLVSVKLVRDDLNLSLVIMAAPTVVGTVVLLSSHVLVPCGCIVLYLLREAERMAIDAASDERAAFDAVEELERLGHELIRAEDIAREAMLEQTRCDLCLLALRRNGFVDHTAQRGYFSLDKIIRYQVQPRASRD